MIQMKFNRELYSKVALIKAAYNFTDRAFVHLDADELYYYVDLEQKDNAEKIIEQEFVNEMLAQCVRHEVYQQTKNIRELLLARSMATSVIVDVGLEDNDNDDREMFNEDEILRDWFENNEKGNI